MAFPRSIRPAARRCLLLLVLSTALTVSTSGAVAGQGSRAGPQHPGWQAECSACHVAYPSRLLPAASWHQLMDSLDQHFGSDATVDPALARDIAAFLEHNAGAPERLRADPAIPRVTRTAWFLRKHAEVPAQTWTRPDVGNAANCAACHTRAAQGDFRERNIRIPR